MTDDSSIQDRTDQTSNESELKQSNDHPSHDTSNANKVSEWQIALMASNDMENSSDEASFQDYLSAYSLLDQGESYSKHEYNAASNDIWMTSDTREHDDTSSDNSNSSHEHYPGGSVDVAKNSCSKPRKAHSSDIPARNTDNNEMVMTNNEGGRETKNDFSQVSNEDDFSEDDDDSDNSIETNSHVNEDEDDDSDSESFEGNGSEEDIANAGMHDDANDDTSSNRNSSLLRELLQRSSRGEGESNLLSAMQRLVGGFENSVFGSQLSEFNTLIENLGQLDDPYFMLETVSEISERLLMMDGLTAERVVPSNKLSQALIGILNNPLLQDDLELHLVTSRCLFNFVEVNSDFINDVLNNGVVEALASKILNIVYIDLTEQCLQTLEIISQENESHNPIIACDGIRACLQNLDFLTIHSQRKCLKIVANSCSDIEYSQFGLIQSQFHELYHVAKDHGDTSVQELAWLAISRIVECFGRRPEDLEKLFLKEEILQQLLIVIEASCISESSGSGTDNHFRQCLLKSLVTLVSGSVPISNLLLDLDIGKFVRSSLNCFKKATDNFDSDATSKKLNLEAFITCPKEILSPFLEVIGYILPIAYSIHESPFLARDITAKGKEINAQRIKCSLHDKCRRSLLSFIEKIWDVLVLAFQATMNYGVRKRCLICFTRIVFFCQMADLEKIQTFSSLATIIGSNFSGCLKAIKECDLRLLDAINGGPARAQALLVYGACVIIKGLLKKSENEFSVLLLKEGVFDDMSRMKDILATFCQRIAEDSSAEPNSVSGNWEYAQCLTGLSDRDFVDGELTDFCNVLTKKPITKRLLDLIEDIETLNAKLAWTESPTHLSDIKEVVAVMEEALSSEESDTFEWIPLWKRLEKLLQKEDDKISSYEIISSGIIKHLSCFLSPVSQIGSVPMLTFVDTFYANPKALIFLVTLLHDSLSRSELFEVVTGGISTRNGVGDFSTLLTKQMKVNLRFGAGFENYDHLPQSVFLSVHSIATFEALDAYVKNAFFSDAYSEEKGFDVIENENSLVEQRLESQFTICGKVITKDSTLFGAIYTSVKSQQSSNKIEASSLWHQSHNVDYVLVPKDSVERLPHIPPPRNEFMDPNSRYTLDLLKSLFSLNANEAERGKGIIIPVEDFMNWKLTVKLNKQLDEPIIIASGCLPSWTFDVIREYPFLFPLETRINFMQSTSFGLARLVHSLQVRASRDQNSVGNQSSSSYGQLGVPSRKKARISRNKLFHSAVRVLLEYGSLPEILEIEYFDEAGSGLGPTLEFYADVSYEFSKSDLRMWNQTHTEGEYVITSKGLFPSALTEFSSHLDTKRVNLLFHVLGIFMARALIDSRILDLHLNTVFISLIQDPKRYNSIFESEDIEAMLGLLGRVDEELANSLSHLTRYFPHFSHIEDDEMVQIDGMTVSDLCLFFVLPGSDSLPLIANGPKIQVTAKNLECFVKKVLLTKLYHGVKDQVQAFRTGFSSVFPIDSIMCFSANELALLFGNSEEDWSIETIEKAIKANHGYSKDSPTVIRLVQIMSEFSHSERRSFLQFMTGSPRLPVGGFQSIRPEFTVVEKHPEAGHSSDEYLPSVMTCANFLKLPNYSSLDVMKSRICHAMLEGAGSFHLS